MTNSILDIAESKCVFIIGSNTFEQHPLIGRKVMQAKLNGGKLIVFDPRKTPTAKQADLYASFYSGTDVAILNCLMGEIIRNGWEDKEWVSTRAKGYEELKAVVLKDEYLPENVEKISGISAADLKTAAEWIGTAESSALLYSMGITQHTVGVDNVKSTANLQMSPKHRQARWRRERSPWPEQCSGRCDMERSRSSSPAPEGHRAPPKEVRRRWGFPDGICEPKNGYEVTVMMDVLVDKPANSRVCTSWREPDALRPGPQPRPACHRELEFLVVQDIFLTRPPNLPTSSSPHLLCREGRHPDLHRAARPDVAQGPGPARRGKGRLADHQRSGSRHGLAKQFPTRTSRRSSTRWPPSPRLPTA
jgi:formate dehydrogenase major subunit